MTRWSGWRRGQVSRRAAHGPAAPCCSQLAPRPLRPHAPPGACLRCRPETPTLQRGATDSLPRLLRLLTPFSGRVALSALLGFLTVASSMGLMSTAAYFISRAALQPSIAELQVAIVGVRFFGLSRGVFRYLERLATHEVTFRLLGGLRGWFYRAVEPLVPARTLHHHSGDLLQRATGDIAALEDFYVRGVAPPFVALLTGLAACLLMGSFSPSMAVFLAFVLLLNGIALPALLLRPNRQLGGELVSRRAALNRALVDCLQGMPDLLASAQAPRFLQSALGRARRWADPDPFGYPQRPAIFRQPPAGRFGHVGCAVAGRPPGGVG